MANQEKRGVDWAQLVTALKVEFGRFYPKFEAFRLVSAVQTRWSPERRAKWMGQVGFRIGRGTLVEGTPQITGNRCNLFENLVIGDDCYISANCVLDLQEKITVGNNVTLGAGAMILTSTHELGPQSHRAGVVTMAPVLIHDGALIRARSIILPGVTIGAGAIVEVGAVVNKDVAPHTRVGGMPATRLETLASP